MNVFRLFLLAAGVAIFLIVRLVATSEASSTGRDALPPATPKTTPSELPGQSHPFPQEALQSAFV